MEFNTSQALFYRSIQIILFAAIAVVFCYFFVDKPVAFFAYDHGFNQIALFRWMTYLPPVLVTLCPIVLCYIAISLSRRALTPFDKTLVAMSLSLAVAFQIKELLKAVFGRFWPETWVNNNPSLIQTHAYGFHWFHAGAAYQSFPSGHTTITFSVMTVLWIAYPKWRWLSVLACGAVILGLLGMDYHFVGDIVAGAAIGSTTGLYFSRLFNL